MGKLDLGILVSGSGTNLQAILDAVAAGELSADVRLVVSNKAEAFALERARRANVPTRVVSHRDFADRTAFDAALVRAMRDAGATTVALAGFMRVLTPVFLDAFPMRVINIHPALLPSFPGVHAQKQALDYGVKIAGCTVHFVDTGTDTGPIIAQAAVAVLDDDTDATLADRVLRCEHKIFVEVLRWMSEGGIDIVRPQGGGRPRVITKGRSAAFLATGPLR
jgi:phosphoribosylglycinamide formyltransferase 1